MSEKNDKWEMIFAVALVVFIILVGFRIASPLLRGSGVTHCPAAVQCNNCNVDKSDCECHYYDEDGQLSQDTVHCDLSSQPNRENN